MTYNLYIYDIISGQILKTLLIRHILELISHKMKNVKVNDNLMSWVGAWDHSTCSDAINHALNLGMSFSLHTCVFGTLYDPRLGGRPMSFFFQTVELLYFILT